MAAAAAAAAVSAASLQGVADEATEPRNSRDVRVWEADIAAARIESDARRAFQANPSQYDEALFRGRCHSIGRLYGDAVSSTQWTHNGGSPSDPARCEVTLR